MKKKIFILIIIVIISFILGICINYFNNQKEPVDNSIAVIGTIVDINNNLASIKPQDTEITSDIDYIKFYLPEGEESSWVIGDIVKAKYLPGHITENNVIELASLESIGKERLFNPANQVSVSNADHRGNGIVFKSFFAYDNSLILDTFSTQDNFYYKKITTYAEYEEYKKIIPELRTLTENDFINYYLVIVLSNKTDTTYMFNDIDEKENALSLELLETKILSELSDKPLYSGVAIILPNVLDVPPENINFTLAK